MVSFVFNPNHYDDIVGFMNNRGYTQAVGSGSLEDIKTFHASLVIK